MTRPARDGRPGRYQRRRERDRLDRGDGRRSLAGGEGGFNVATTFTNPANGASLVGRFAGVKTNEIVAGLESGPHTHEFVENGLRAKLKLPNGGVLTRDAGSLTYRISFDAADNFTGLEIVSVHGPHPAFDSPVWCEEAIAALGL